MADQTNRGGQKQGNQNPQNPEQYRPTRADEGQAGAEGYRADQDIRKDQMTNPDDARRQPTDRDEQR